MIIHHADRTIVKWAVDRGYPYEYIREYGLPEPALRVQLGMSSAMFHKGKLLRWRVDADAEYMDQLMYELASLFGWCSVSKAYPKQQVVVSIMELAALRAPPAESA